MALLGRSLSQPAYRKRLNERFAWFFNPLQKNTLWFHAASVGEVNALKPVLHHLWQQQPEQKITLTTFTPTGSAQVSRLFQAQRQQQLLQHCYFPIDIWPVTFWFLKQLKPKAVIFMETELWPNLMKQLADTNTPTLLINARLSDKSLPRYLQLKALFTPCIQRFTKILCQSEENAERYRMLGASAQRCFAIGNIKYDLTITATMRLKLDELSRFITTKRTIWLVASTHEGDEAIVLSAFKKLQRSFPELLLIIAPRHPERFDTVAKLIAQQSLIGVRRSEQTSVTPKHQVWLLDTLGELGAAYGLADVVTVAGSFSAIGGHNPLEPALFAKPTLVGADMKNFAEITAQLLAQHALIQLSAKSPDSIEMELTQQLQQLLADPTLQQQLGQAAYQVVLNNQGASERCVTHIQAMLAADNQKASLPNSG